MTITTTSAADVCDLLTDGKTLEEVVEATGWPHQRIKAVANGKGWMWDEQGRTYDPRTLDSRKGRPTQQIPNGAQPATTKTAPAAKPAPAPKPTPPPPPAAARPDPRITMLPLDQIEPHPRNVRKVMRPIGDLADSFKVHGILQPLVVQAHPAYTGRYQIIAGHRRHAAAEMAGLTQVPAIVREATGQDLATVLMLIENVQREDLNPMDKADALGDLRDRGYTLQRITDETGIPTSTASHFLALLDLDQSSQDKVRAGKLAVAHAVTAVRKTRAKERKKAGSTADYTWEPDHFTGRHSLAKKAGQMCDAREHTMRRRLGDTACGQCWETAIRMDERTVMAAAGGA